MQQRKDYSQFKMVDADADPVRSGASSNSVAALEFNCLSTGTGAAFMATMAGTPRAMA